MILFISCTMATAVDVDTLQNPVINDEPMINLNDSIDVDTLQNPGINDETNKS